MATYEDEVAEYRLRQINADRQQALAHLARARAEGDKDTGALYVQEIADLDSAAERVVGLHQRHIAHNQPPPPPNKDAWKTKKAEEMTDADVFMMLNETSETAKLGGGISAEAYQQQIDRLHREKRAGNYSGKP
jgi:hypothetical protein